MVGGHSSVSSCNVRCIPLDAAASELLTYTRSKKLSELRNTYFFPFTIYVDTCKHTRSTPYYVFILPAIHRRCCRPHRRGEKEGKKAFRRFRATPPLRLSSQSFKGVKSAGTVCTHTNWRREVNKHLHLHLHLMVWFGLDILKRRKLQMEKGKK